MAVDLVLSSGFLAFARHCGFLRAVETAQLEVQGLCGTSSGALVGALWASGLSAAEVATRLAAERPLAGVGLSRHPWRGLFSLAPMTKRLASMLPARFCDLKVSFAVGVTARDGTHRLVREGQLLEAVVASCSIPYLFEPVTLGGALFADGGAADRLGLRPWLALGRGNPTVVHLVERTHGAVSSDDLQDVTVVRSPRSGASFFGLGDFAAQEKESYTTALAALSAISGAAAAKGV